MNEDATTRAREDRAMPRPIVGERLVLIRDVDRYPHFVAARGSRGTIAEVSPEAVSLRLDEQLPGAEEWDNEIVWSADFGQDIWTDAEALSEAQEDGG
jgi:hypothetical protein